MPKQTIFLETPVFMFSLLRIFEFFWRNNWRSIFDVVERLCYCRFLYAQKYLRISNLDTIFFFVVFDISIKLWLKRYLSSLLIILQLNEKRNFVFLIVYTSSLRMSFILFLLLKISYFPNFSTSRVKISCSRIMNMHNVPMSA